MLLFWFTALLSHANYTTLYTFKGPQEPVDDTLLNEDINVDAEEYVEGTNKEKRRKGTVDHNGYWSFGGLSDHMPSEDGADNANE